MAKIGDLTVKLNVSKVLRPSREHEVMHRIEEFLSREFAVAMGPNAEVRLRIESIDHRYDDYRRDAHRISLRLEGYVMKRRTTRPSAEGGALVPDHIAEELRSIRPGDVLRGPTREVALPKSRAVGRARVVTKTECAVCKAPPGEPCTPSCDDDNVPDSQVKRYVLPVWSDDEERRRYGRDLERGQASTTAKAPKARRFGPMRKDGVAIEDVATLADLLCEEVEP